MTVGRFSQFREVATVNTCDYCPTWTMPPAVRTSLKTKNATTEAAAPWSMPRLDDETADGLRTPHQERSMFTTSRPRLLLQPVGLFGQFRRCA